VTAGSSLSPAERVLKARIGANELHAQGKGNTGPAIAARFQRYLDAVDPDHVLPEAVRVKRAEHARLADMYRMSLKASRARTAKKAATSHPEPDGD
jgi:hypothetical protein